jgi:3-oxoacyl-[acyl-carrier-protein] synthase II
VKAVITGSGWVTPTTMGYGRNHDSFEWRWGKLPEITRKAVFEEPYPHFGRLDRYSRLGLSAIAFALKDAGLNRWTQKRDIGIIASTLNGCLDTDIDYFDTVMIEEGRMASPHLFAYTLPNSYLGEASIRFGLTGTGFIISEPSASGLWCLRMSLIGIAGGQFEKVVCGMCDLDHLPPFTESDKTPCGALFLVIEKTPRHAHLVYGDLCLDKHGALMFNSKEIKSLPMLTQKCLTAFAARDENTPEV